MWRVITCRGVATGVLIAVMVAFGHAVGNAQSVDAILTGRLYDQQGAGLPGARISATHEATGMVRSVTADECGHYVFVNLPAGTYFVRAELDGFAPSVRQHPSMSARRSHWTSC